VTLPVPGVRPDSVDSKAKPSGIRRRRYGIAYFPSPRQAREQHDHKYPPQNDPDGVPYHLQFTNKKGVRPLQRDSDGLTPCNVN
jgi:hypothetical protein